MSGIELIALLAAAGLLAFPAIRLLAAATTVRNGSHSERIVARSVRNGALCPVAIPTEKHTPFQR
jgi:hypothetical protein